MRNWILVLLMLTAGYLAKAQYSGYRTVADKDAFKQQFASASLKIGSIKSDFVQEKNLSMLSDKIVSKGVFWFKKENLVRMEYSQPFSYLMILSGNNVYIKDGQRESKVSTKSNKLFGQINQVIVDCVRGTALNNPDFSVRVFENASSFLIELTPTTKNLIELFKNINIVVDKKDFSASKIEMFEASGDYSTITFTNKQLNGDVSDTLFVVH
jgi:outer membrane lipoprotein-sorting protein